MIVDLRVRLIRANIPQEHCPFAYYYLEDLDDRDIDCNEITCEECNDIFFREMRKAIEKDVKKL